MSFDIFLLFERPERKTSYLPHCGRCGRFIKPKTVREIQHWENWLEFDSRGDCSACGPDVAVSWPEV